VHLSSLDPEKTLAWYHNIFGGERTKMKGQFDAIVCGKVWLLAGRAKEPVAATEGRAIDHLGFSFPDLDAAAAEIRQKGVSFQTEPRALTNPSPSHAKISFIIDRITFAWRLSSLRNRDESVDRTKTVDEMVSAYQRALPPSGVRRQMEEAKKWRRNQSDRYRIQLRLLPMALTPGRTAFKVPISEFRPLQCAECEFRPEGRNNAFGPQFRQPTALLGGR
jgi:hypothetical protein